jgi:hypothetical protein
MKSKLNTLFVVGIFLRVAGVWIPQLWYDENFTLILARLPFDRMLAATAGDVHPPLWYLIEWAFIRHFPYPSLAPAWTLRIPALVFSVLALWVFRLVLDQLAVPQKAKLGAFTLMAILPMQLWYAQEARMYSLLEFEVLLTLWLCLKRSHPLTITAVSLAMLFTQNYALFYLAGIGAVVLLRDIQKVIAAHRLFGLTPRLRAFEMTAYIGLSMLSAAFFYSVIWLDVVRDQMKIINGRYWIQEQSVGDVLNTLYKLFWGSSMPSFALLPGILTTFMALALGLVILLHADHPAKWTVIVMAFAPLALAWIASVVWQPILLHRPLIGITPFLYIVAAWSLTRLDGVFQRETVLTAALVIPLFVSGLGGYFKNIPAMKSDGAISPLISALDYVKAHWQDGDVIYYTDDGPMVNLSPYAGGLPQYMMSACGDRLNTGPVLGSLSPRTREAMGVTVTALEDVPHKRAWVFAPRSPLHPVCYEQQIASYAPGDPLIVVDDNEFISSGVWLVEK